MSYPRLKPGLGKAEDKKAYYLSKKIIFEPLMYPHPSTYSVIKIPVIPFPPAILRKLIKVLGRSKTEIADAGLDAEYVRMLVSIGIIVELLSPIEGIFILLTREDSFWK